MRVCATRLVSVLTPASAGLTAELLAQHGMPLATALATLRASLPRDAVLVGQNIAADVRWLGLVEGTDFGALVDLVGVYRCWNPQYKSWSMFGQEHVARVLLGVDDGDAAHNAVTDAQKSVRLFNLHHTVLAHDPAQLATAHAALLSAPQQQSFARRNPQFEGVCMGARKTCTCGGAFFY